MTLKEKTAFFDHHAVRWDETMYSPAQSARIRPLIERLNISRGAKVLDVGCGTGVLIPHLLDAVGPAGTVIGIDISPIMVAKACDKGFLHNAWFVVAPIENSPFPEEYFDAVVCLSVFPHFIDHRRALSEIHRLLSPSGMIAILHLDGSARINDFHKGFGDPVMNDHLPDGAEMKSLLIEAGFVSLEAEDRKDLYLVSGKKPIAGDR